MNAVTATRKSVVDQIFGQNKAPIETVLQADFADLAVRVEALVARGRTLPARVDTEAQQIAVGSYIVECRALFKEIEAEREAEGRPLLDGKRRLDAFFKGFGTALDDATGPLQRAADDFMRRQAAEARAKAQREEQEARDRAEKEREKAEAARTPEAAGRAEARAEQLDAQADRAAGVAAASTSELAAVRGNGISGGARETWTARIDDYPAAIAPLGALGPYLKSDAVDAALKSMAKVQKGNARWPGVNFSVETKATFRG